MDANKKIEARRLEMGLSENQVAEAIGISFDSYCNIEWHADELCRAVERRRIKNLSQILGLEHFELLALQCPFCNAGTASLGEYHLPRNELNKNRSTESRIKPKGIGESRRFL